MSLHPISWKNLVKKLKSLGFEGPYSGGKHLFMLLNNQSLTIPNPHGTDIGISLLKRILKQANIQIEEWEKL